MQTCARVPREWGGEGWGIMDIQSNGNDGLINSPRLFSLSKWLISRQTVETKNGRSTMNIIAEPLGYAHSGRVSEGSRKVVLTLFLLLPVWLKSLWLLMYTSCIPEAPYAFNDILINYIYRKKKLIVWKHVYLLERF